MCTTNSNSVAHRLKVKKFEFRICKEFLVYGISYAVFGILYFIGHPLLKKKNKTENKTLIID